MKKQAAVAERLRSEPRVEGVDFKPWVEKLALFEATHCQRKAFVNPCETEPPLPLVVFYNPSSNACNSTMEEVRRIWGDKVTIVQVVGKNTTPNPMANYALEITDLPENWADPALVMRALLAFSKTPQGATLNVHLESSIPPALYCAWSPQAESMDVVEAAQRCGFKSISASAEGMRKIDGKILFKQKCEEAEVPSSKFHVFKALDALGACELTPSQKIEKLADELIAYLNAPENEEERALGVFVKHEKGGGGRGTKSFYYDPFELIEDLRVRAISVIGVVLNGVNNNFEGLYIERSMKQLYKPGTEPEEAQKSCTETLMQLELEVMGFDEAGEVLVSPGGRLVFFTPEFQKSDEPGFSDAFICRHLGQGSDGVDVYQQCRDAAARLAKSAGYDNRGTTEFLIVKVVDKVTGKITYRVSATENNGRRQVEARALSDRLFYVQSEAAISQGLPQQRVSVTATQMMVSCGYAPYLLGKDVVEDPNADCVIHLRLTNGTPGVSAWKYDGGYVLSWTWDGGVLPEWCDVTLIPPGKIQTSKDPQLGCVIIRAENWEQAVERQALVANHLRVQGKDGDLCANILAFQAGLAASPAYQTMALSCEKTSQEVLSARQPALDAVVMRHRSLTPLVQARVNGVMKPAASSAVNAARDFFEPRLGTPTTPKANARTAYISALKAGDPEARVTYIAAKREVLMRHGGGLSDVTTRDTFQQRFGSQSVAVMALMNWALREYGADCFTTFEAGGAQYDVAAKLGLDPLSGMMDQMFPEIGMQMLTRSDYVTSLYSKGPLEQKMMFEDMARLMRGTLGLPEGAPVPVTMNNFHAGNHAIQDQTTALMLQAGFEVTPNFVFNMEMDDHGRQVGGFSLEDARVWVKRQIALFVEMGKPLSELRIKNPGQSPAWTSDNIMVILDIFAEESRSAGIDVPIFNLHNHAANDLSTDIAVAVLRQCQLKGYLLVVDAAVPLKDTDLNGVTHNSNVRLAEVLNYTTEERDALLAYNQVMRERVLPLVSAYDNESTRVATMDPDTRWALGTTTSDIESAKAIGIPVGAIEHLKLTALQVFQFYGVVTPYSEILKSLGYAMVEAMLGEIVYPDAATDRDRESILTAAIKEKITAESVSEYIQAKGKLSVDPRYLAEIQEWKTMVSMPEIVRTFLANHGLVPKVFSPRAFPGADVSLAPLPAALQDARQRWPYLDAERSAMMVMSWGATAEQYLDRANLGMSLTDISRTQPWELFRSQSPLETAVDGALVRQVFTVGETVQLQGDQYTVLSASYNEKTAVHEIVFKDEATTQSFSVLVLDRERALALNLLKPVVIAKGPNQIGASGAGLLLSFNVVLGQKLSEGDIYAHALINKMIAPLRVPKSADGKCVKELCLSPGDGIDEFGQLLIELQKG